MPGGTLRGSDQGGAVPVFPLPNQLGKSAWLSSQVLCPQRCPPGQVCPGGEGGRPGENRRGRWVGPSRTRGAEGICPTHSGLGNLLRSQADLPPSKAHSRPRGSWGHRREGGEIKRGRQEEQEKSRGLLPCPLEPRKPAGLPGGVPRPVGGTPGPLLFC